MQCWSGRPFDLPCRFRHMAFFDQWQWVTSMYPCGKPLFTRYTWQCFHVVLLVFILYTWWHHVFVTIIFAIKRRSCFESQIWKRKRNSFFVFRSLHLKTKNEKGIRFSFANLKTKKEKTVYTRTSNATTALVEIQIVLLDLDIDIALQRTRTIFR